MASWQVLLKKDNAFVWSDEHEVALNKVKVVITNPEGLVLKHFDPKLPIQVLTDASGTGIGFCWVQTDVGSKIPLLIIAGVRYYIVRTSLRSRLNHKLSSKVNIVI